MGWGNNIVIKVRTLSSNKLCYTRHMIEENTTAPDFTLKDQAGIDHSLSDYLGQWVLVYFYPKDDTPGCTIEACSIRDAWEDFKQAGVTVLGVNADTTTSHKKFADKYQLPFILLSDPEKQVLKKYGAFQGKNMFGRRFTGINRISYLIDPKGKIFKIYPKVNPSEHANNVLADVASFN